MNMLSLIQSRKSGQALTAEEMNWLVRSVMAGEIPDYQLAVLLTVFCYEGLSTAETLAMTTAFIDSGDTLSWDDIERPVVDKHSTGGVGDKITLALAPMLAAAGLAMPKMSGRGLGHTGGTIDKLESIPGLRTDLSPVEFRRVLQETGCAVAGQTARLVPADKVFYALRDATDNVRELGLVTASIMSKKLAAGAPSIVLDVKCGNGAFFRDLQEARSFSSLAMKIGKDAGRRVACVITDMSQPLGRAVGNRLEVMEVMQLLSGSAELPDLRAVLLAIGSTELVLSGSSPDLESAELKLTELLDSGAVNEKFREWIAAQGGRLDEVPAGHEDLTDVESVSVVSESAGILKAIDCLAIGNLARRCGAGRLSQSDIIAPDAGLLCDVAIGDRIEKGQELLRMFVGIDQQEDHADLEKTARAAFTISADAEAEALPPVLDRLMP